MVEASRLAKTMATQGGSGGESLKEVEEEGLAILVVCDTGSVGVSGRNYVLEGREVDGFFEDATKVVDYIVKYVIEPMEGKLIIFSKWIHYCLLLIDVRVKDIRDVREYVEDKEPWFRRGLGLNYTCTVTPCWEEMFQWPWSYLVRFDDVTRDSCTLLAEGTNVFVKRVSTL